MGEAVVVQGARAGQGLAALLTGVPEGGRGFKLLSKVRFRCEVQIDKVEMCNVTNVSHTLPKSRYKIMYGTHSSSKKMTFVILFV